MNISEDTFVSWAKGPGTTEADKCKNAETAIKKAIAADEKLSKMDVSVFAQGSYPSRTNVRLDSDVDICVRYNDAFFDTYPEGKTREDFGNVPGTLAFAQFKQYVGAALITYFDDDAVTPGNKAFDVHANSYRVDADVVPAFEYRWYTGRQNGNGSHQYHSGVAFLPDKGNRIVNYPDQTDANGTSRNNETGRHYKRVIRILKRLRNKMQEDRIQEANDIASFLIECLVWNCPVEAFQHDRYADDVRYVLAHTYNNTREDSTCSEWGEVNELKYLFRKSQPWTREQANAFLNAAWDYIGFK
ncbi:MAG: nucleotidyltransferase [Verrucomicrobia bacterium]|nr:MAG: nucleotidyltransferase [Verrucomicrobiota bacterium]